MEKEKAQQNAFRLASAQNQIFDKMIDVHWALRTSTLINLGREMVEAHSTASAPP